MAVRVSGETVALGSEHRGGLIVYGQKPLSLTGGLEPAHDLFASSSVAMGGLGTVIQPLVPAMFQPRSEICLGGGVRAELVRDQHAQSSPTLEELAEEPVGRMSVSSGLDEDVENVTSSIDRTPEPVFDAFDHNHDLVEMPLVC